MPNAAISPYLVSVAAVGGTAVVGEHGVAVAGLEAKQDLAPKSTAIAGDLGVAVTADEGESRAGAYGAALTGKRGIATGGAGVMASASDAGTASVGDGGVARIAGYGGHASADYGVAYCVHDGVAVAADRGVALVESGMAKAGRQAIASVRMQGHATTGDDGIAIVWNEAPNPSASARMEAAGTPVLSGGRGSLLLTFAFDEHTGRRKLVIGFIGAASDVPVVHANLDPNVGYQYNSLTGQFERTKSPPT